jgi:hypothetical protein
MTRKGKSVTWIAIVVIAIGLAAIAVRVGGNGSLRHMLAPISLAGAVLRQDKDPRKQAPLSDADVTAVDGRVTVRGKSDSSGFFALTIHPQIYAGRQLALTFEHTGYKPLEITVPIPANRLCIVRMQALGAERGGKANSEKNPLKPIRIKDVRIRYVSKDRTTVSIGSLAKQFEVPNIGNVPCERHEACSPDGKWKAATNLVSLDAEDGNEFEDMRVSCIAGPCPFTRVEAGDLSRPARKIRIRLVNWSDTADFLVEADVSRTIFGDIIHHSYPFIVGQTMSFALPPGSEGLSIEADLDGQAIVFPLGPDLILTWATCGVETRTGGNKTYRCQLKPGYEFGQ